jgi:DNA/RNA-binding domain of Phe-tRNA-synthetase-like protein
VIELTKSWLGLVPDAGVGLLWIKNVPNTSDHPDLAVERKKLAASLRKQYADLDRQSLRSDPVYAVYDAFYRKFRKTYHLQLQLESVVFKEKAIFSPSALVSAMFMAELKTGLLTAGHDVAALKPDLKADVATGDETFQRMSGENQQLKEGDLYIADHEGILSSIIYGPDQRSQIQNETDQVIYTTYRLPGISGQQVREQFEYLEYCLRLFAPDAEREMLLVT